ncbi:sensor histidine kinase [Ottowia thiooxydans]|uniref:sensor histidine kinase n=1 Tax=Ottowia thiooxydans TaxID=219182 RepID=UPI00041D82AF|nr:HAMP domain-containing sensor histidine kinase [Ottowia thiooxydans]
MRRNRSLGWRIAWTLTALINLAVVLAALASYQIYHHMRERMIDDFIVTESERLTKRINETQERWQQAFEHDIGPSMFAWVETPSLFALSMPEELRGLEFGIHYLPRERSVWHVSVTEMMDGKLYVMYDSLLVEQQSRIFAFALMAIVLVFSILAFLISVRISHWLIAPLNVLVERLTRWAPSGAQTATSPSNELDRLMDAFNRVLDQVDAAITDQRQFSANLQHEIRTPLAIIRSDAELLLRSHPAAPTRESTRLQRIMGAVDEIKESLESTYSLSNAYNGGHESVQLHACVQDVGEGLRMEASQTRLDIENKVQSEHVEYLNRYALLTVMRNIVRNAIKHAAPATLEVRSIPHGLVFTDTGPGISETELPYIFDRYASRRRVDARPMASGADDRSDPTERTGLGLAIAIRVCTLQSWEIKAESPVELGRGARFTLLFKSETSH